MIRIPNLPGLMLDRTHPLARGLVSWWPLNEGAGSRANDVCGLAPGSTAGTVKWSGGALGTAPLLANSYVNVGHYTAHQFTTDFTFCAWICPTSGSSYPPLLSKSSGGADGYSWEFANSAETGGLALWRYSGGWGSNGYTPVTNGVWSFVAVAHGGGKERRYVNGALITEYASAISVAVSTASLQIANNSTMARNYGGGVSHFRLYNRALSPEEVRVLYQHPLSGAAGDRSLAPIYPGPVAVPPDPALPLSSDRFWRNRPRVRRRGEA